MSKANEPAFPPEYWGKFKKGGNTLVGFLSKGKRRWLPKVSKHEHLVIRSNEDRIKIDQEFKSKYGWQSITHKYYYQSVPIASADALIQELSKTQP